MARVPPTKANHTPARHDPELSYEEMDPAGKVRTYFMLHPGGNRKQRRFKMRHHPFHHKTHTKGRAWRYSGSQ